MSSQARLGVVETGNEVYIKFVVTAPVIAPSATSTAVTFTIHYPDDTEVSVSSPNASITGPTAGTAVVDGVSCATTTWHYKTPAFTKVGNSTVRARSTAGILCSDDSTIYTPAFAPFGP